MPHGLAFAPAADRTMLIRRATFDLIGLPPNPEEVEAFVSDPRPDAGGVRRRCGAFVGFATLR